MLLEIDDWRTIGDIQYRFNKCFPNLDLQVYDAATGTNLLDGATPLERVRRSHQPGVLTIKSWFSKNEVEALLLEEFGLKTLVVPLGGPAQLCKDDEGLSLQELNEKYQPVLAGERTAENESEEWLEGLY